MKLTVPDKFRYESEALCRLFFPFEKMDEQGDGEMRAAIELTEEGAKVGFSAAGFSRGAEVAPDDGDLLYPSAVALFEMLCEYTGERPKWGILTGVRPGKLMRNLAEQLGEEGAINYFEDRLKVSGEKAKLCLTAAKNEQKIIERSTPDNFSLYLSVPFCPTRCSYCSFVSRSVENAKKLIDPYVDLLCEEIKYTAQIANRLSLRLSTVYMGGGTPTTLSAAQLDRVLSTVRGSFDMSGVAELTVEAGRPDTVDGEKLCAIKENGTTRISINPQTMSDSVLEAIGRRHTAAQTVDAFLLARKLGFDNINMDLIAGLPTDTLDGYMRTVDRVIDLDPESVTVHTLSMKRSSNLTGQKRIPGVNAGNTADKMLAYSQPALEQNGYIPYYLYRQSKTVGNLENTGFSKPGKEGLYNIYIMDETHSILACGAGATTKLKGADGFISRIYNFKYPYEYNSRFEEMTARKNDIEKFYGEHCKNR